MPNYKKTLLSLCEQLDLSLNVDELVDDELFQKTFSEFLRANIKSNLDSEIIIPENVKNEMGMNLNLIIDKLKENQQHASKIYKNAKNIMKDLYEIEKKNKKKEKKKLKKQKKKNDIEEEDEDEEGTKNSTNMNMNMNMNSIIIRVYNILWKQLLLDLGNKFTIAFNKITTIMDQEGDTTLTIYNNVQSMDILKFGNNKLRLPSETIEDMIFVLIGKKTFLSDSGSDACFIFDENNSTKDFMDSVLSQPNLYSLWNTIQMISYFFVYIPPENLVNLEKLVRQLHHRHGSRHSQKMDFRSVISSLVQTLTMI